MSLGTQAYRDGDGLFRLVADRLPLLVWISGVDKLCTYFNKPWLDFTGRPSRPRSAMVGQTVYTPQICSIVWNVHRLRPS
jgi:hypothetical protein